MTQPSEKLTRLLILFVIGVFIIKSLSGSSFFEARSYRGKGFYVRIPEGWTKVKKEKGTVYPQGVDLVQFIPKNTNLEIKKPDAIITVYSEKLIVPIWVEDELPNIVRSLIESGYSVKDKGEIKLDGEISSWVVYYDRKNNLLNLEFYIVSDNNMFFKMQYSAEPDQFKRYRLFFEELKDSFRFRFSL